MTILQFIHQLQWEAIPVSIQKEGIRSLLDTVGALVVGSTTNAAQLVHNFAATTHGGQGSFLVLDGREVSRPAAAFANAMAADALGFYGGHSLAKGIASGPLLASLLATLPPETTGKTFLTTWIMGLEIAFRTGMALHSTTMYSHTACTWNIIGVAATAASQLKLTKEQTQHALGIAEYIAPLAPVRSTLVFPSMLRTGAAWAAMGGVNAALLAQQNFTGAMPSMLLPTANASVWSTLGNEWQLEKYYYKPNAVNRWIQPSIDAILAIRQKVKHQLETIHKIEIHTFAAVLKDLKENFPLNIEEAQFSLCFSVATFLVYDSLNKPSTFYAAFDNELVRQLFDKIQLVKDANFTAKYPAKRLSKIVIEVADGTIYQSGDTEGSWSASEPPTDEALQQKFRSLTKDILSDAKINTLEQTLWGCADLENAAVISNLLRTI